MSEFEFSEAELDEKLKRRVKGKLKPEKERLRRLKSYSEFRRIAINNIGRSGTEKVEDYVASRVPLVYTDQVNNIISILEDLPAERSEYWADFKRRLKGANSASEVIAGIKRFEKRRMGVWEVTPIIETLAPRVADKIPIPAQRILGARVDTLRTSQKVIGFESKDITAIKPKRGKIVGPKLQGDTPSTFQVIFNGTGIGGIIVWVMWVTTGCAASRNWIPYMQKMSRIRGTKRINFKLVPNQEDVTAYRIQPIGVNLRAARVKRTVQLPFHL